MQGKSFIHLFRSPEYYSFYDVDRNGIVSANQADLHTIKPMKQLLKITLHYYGDMFLCFHGDGNEVPA